jgi:hypothetical protein
VAASRRPRTEARPRRTDNEKGIDYARPVTEGRVVGEAVTRRLVAIKRLTWTIVTPLWHMDIDQFFANGGARDGVAGDLRAVGPSLSKHAHRRKRSSELAGLGARAGGRSFQHRGGQHDRYALQDERFQAVVILFGPTSSMEPHAEYSLSTRFGGLISPFSRPCGL